MIPGRVAGLGLIILGLSATIAFEIANQTIQPKPLPVRQARVTETAIHSRVAVSKADIDGWFGEVLARPIFNPDRRPVGAGARSPTGLSRLTGIIVTGSRKVAIFAAPSGGRPVIVEEGSRVNAYEVKAITGTGVTLMGPEGETMITPVFGAAPPAAKPVALLRPEALRAAKN